ncbi:hypothetical protein AAG906_015984 [Vitis piasezkii]
MIRDGKRFYITFINDYSSSGAPLNSWREAILSACHIQNRTPYNRNLKTFDAFFIGYADNSVACRFLVTKSENSLVDVNTIIETKNVDFFENIFPMKLNGQPQVRKTSRDESFEPSEFEPRRSKRGRKETSLGDGFYTFLIDEDPKSYKEAITFPDTPLW